MRTAWNALERIGLFVMLPFTLLAELLLQIPEVERAAKWLLVRLSKLMDRGEQP